MELASDDNEPFFFFIFSLEGTEDLREGDLKQRQWTLHRGETQDLIKSLIQSAASNAASLEREMRGDP